MPRNKYPEETVEKIINASMKCFLEKGYEKTTVLDIVKNLGGLTRGAFYHHFKSKEEVLCALMSKIAQPSTAFFSKTQENGLTGLEKFNIYAKAEQKLYNNPSYRDNVVAAMSLTKDPRFLIEKVFYDKLTARKFFAPLIEEGIKDGSIEQQDAKCLAELTLIIINFWLSPVVFHNSKEELSIKLKFIKKLFEDIGFAVIDEELYNDLLNTCQILNEAISSAPMGALAERFFHEAAESDKAD